MEIIKKMTAKAVDNSMEGVTIAFLGDSVTQGCFEIYKNESGVIEPVFDKRHSYPQYLYNMFCTLFPSVNLNIINAGISGDKAPKGLERLERDIVRHCPDLTVVCYGLNDCSTEEKSVEAYTNALEGIFRRLKAEDIEIIFMTPNMMNTGISVHLHDEDFLDIAKKTAMMQNEGVFDAHIEAARRLCGQYGIPVCDCYSIWRKLDESGVDVTELLSNKINHPTREMNKIFAQELIRTMFLTEK